MELMKNFKEKDYNDFKTDVDAFVANITPTPSTTGTASSTATLEDKFAADYVLGIAEAYHTGHSLDLASKRREIFGYTGNDDLVSLEKLTAKQNETQKEFFKRIKSTKKFKKYHEAQLKKYAESRLGNAGLALRNEKKILKAINPEALTEILAKYNIISEDNFEKGSKLKKGIIYLGILTLGATAGFLADRYVQSNEGYKPLENVEELNKGLQFNHMLEINDQGTKRYFSIKSEESVGYVLEKINEAEDGHEVYEKLKELDKNKNLVIEMTDIDLSENKGKKTVDNADTGAKVNANNGEASN